MNYYSFIGDKEPLGTDKCFINRNVKRFNQTITYKLLQKADIFRVYTFTNFYDNNTFKLVMKRG